MASRNNFNNLTEPGIKVISGNFQLPNTFEVVLKKMNDEIDSIIIKEVVELSSLGYYGLSLEDETKIMVSIVLRFKQGTDGIKGNSDKYSEIINTLFNATYPEHNFIHFRVDSLEIPPKKTNRESFLELFLCQDK